MEEKYLRMAIDAARKSRSDSSNPLVGAVVVTKDGKVEVGYRGEIEAGDHAEFTVLEKKMRNDVLAGATVYTTLEPCTTRGHPKVPCANRLVERKVARVFVGMLDPNVKILGQGVRRLQDAGIEVQLFPQDFANEVEELNRDFKRSLAASILSRKIDPRVLAKLQERRLDDWYRNINRTYWNQNYYRAPSEIFSHLVEVVGGMSTLASDKKKVGIEPERHIAKALAWWLTLCGKLGIKSVEAMLWDKFPGVCPYCQRSTHRQDVCNQAKANTAGPNWPQLAQLAEKQEPPKRLRDWQRMYDEIYPTVQTEAYGQNFARLSEELGELAEAVRVFRTAPGYLLSEAADVFAWLMRIQNVIDTKRGVSTDQRGMSIEKIMSEQYPDGCSDCGQEVCNCRPILEKTIGRIAHEVPPNRTAPDKHGRFLTPENASKFFQE